MLLTSHSVRLRRLPTSLGMDPLKPFRKRYSLERPRSIPTSEGIGPLNVFQRRSNVVKVGPNSPTDTGIEPDNVWNPADIPTIWFDSLHSSSPVPQEHSGSGVSQFSRPLMLIPFAANVNLWTSWSFERVSWFLVSTSVIHTNARLSGDSESSNGTVGRRDSMRARRPSEKGVDGTLDGMSDGMCDGAVVGFDVDGNMDGS